VDILLSLAAELATALVFLGMASLAVYWALVRGFKPHTAILAGALMIIIYVGGSFALDQTGPHPDSWTSIQQTFDQIWQTKSKTLIDDKMPQADVDAIQALFKKYFLFCLPAWIIVGSLLLGLLAYYLVSAFGLIVGGVVILVSPPNTWMEMVGDNLLVLFLAVYTFAGLTITSFYFKKWRFPVVARVLSYALLFELTFNAVCILGIMDIWLDFRKLKKPPTETTT
jgi:hypothetical protein